MFEYVKILKKVLHTTGFIDKPGSVYNQHGNAFLLNNTVANKTIAQKGDKHVISRTCTEQGENLTVSVCIYAIGHIISPFVIPKHKQVYNEHVD